MADTAGLARPPRALAAEGAPEIGKIEAICLAPVHVGCFELFGSDKVRSIGDLNAKTVGVQAIGSQPHTLVTLMAGQVATPTTNGANTIPRIRCASMRCACMKRG